MKLQLLEGVGYNADAYEIAKNRLGRRYGGERRKVGLFLEEVEKFDRIKQGNAIDLERFSNFLDVLVLNLKVKIQRGRGKLSAFSFKTSFFWGKIYSVRKNFQTN